MRSTTPRTSVRRSGSGHEGCACNPPRHRETAPRHRHHHASPAGAQDVNLRRFLPADQKQPHAHFPSRCLAETHALTGARVAEATRASSRALPRRRLGANGRPLRAGSKVRETAQAGEGHSVAAGGDCTACRRAPSKADTLAERSHRMVLPCWRQRRLSRRLASWLTQSRGTMTMSEPPRLSSMRPVRSCNPPSWCMNWPLHRSVNARSRGTTRPRPPT